MNQEKETFFDKNTLIAIFLLGLCWVGWDYYMKKKYPGQAKQEQSEAQTKAEEASPSNISSVKTADQKIKSKGKETTYVFSGEKMEFVLSSFGMGFKEIRLKSFFDRDKQPVVFKNEEAPPLSATGLLKTEELIPFKVRREKNKFIGHYASKNLEVTKILEVDEDNFIFKTQIEVSRQSRHFTGLRLFFYQAVPQSAPKSWISKMLFIVGQDVYGGFVFSEEKSEQIVETELETPKNYQNLSILGLGSRYFGQAFLNKSSLLPSGILKKREKGLQGVVDYKPLTTSPFSLDYEVFYGPKSLEHLAKRDSRLGKWINFGFFEWLARPLLQLLRGFHKITGNWGFAIILLTFFVRLLLLPLNIRSYKSMKAMQKIQPQLQELREKHKKDPQTLNREMMALMKDQKANPLGGCLPLMLVQLPVFIALYRVLGESIELYQAPFILWIRDLSLFDPWYVLPVLSGATLFVQQKITPMNVPPAQARLFTLMPLVFSVFMLKLPSGLTLYIFVSGLFGLIQQFFFVKWKKEKA
ncbi:MAG: membrane protein insertase YidC [Bdellovibrionales bacterium]|nr:membrane protein insertase YidC [Bdellovibrionales bacterium]